MGLANDDDPIFFYHKMPQSSRGRAFDGVVTPSADGDKNSAIVRVASIVPFLVIKGMALYDRLKGKDTWDIYFWLCNYSQYPGDLDALVAEFQPHIERGIVREGLRKIAQKFASPEQIRSIHVANFEELIDSEAREIRQQDAYQRVNYLLEQLNIT